MRYLKAYAKAWWTLWSYAGMGWIVLATVLYILGLKMDPLVLPYLFYVVSSGALGGVVREQFLSSK